MNSHKFEKHIKNLEKSDELQQKTRNLDFSLEMRQSQSSPLQA
jgi:hypothetical protein